MKNTVAVLLACFLLLSAIPFSSAQAENALPEVGDVVCGFTVKEKRDFSMIGADLVLFEHEKTGARLMYIANNDINRAFDLTFFTRASDNTGLPHVFEHATLNGSDRYPSDDLFFNMIYQTYNTFLNAQTTQLYTTYPMASLSEAQLLRYADFYTDSCLHPRILEEESIFREEAWRYRLASEEDALTIEGTVYSEMLSSFDLTTAARYNWMRASFPGATGGNSYGGDPSCIASMTWDSLKAYHAEYYHPSNCFAYLYGSFEDYTAFLELLDREFSPYDRRTFSFEEEYTPLTESVTESVPFPMEENAYTDGSSMIYYSFLCPGLNKNPEEELLLNTLTDLLISDSSVLMQRLRNELPYGYCSAYIDRTGPEDSIAFYAMYVNPEDAETFRTIVDESLAEIAEKGFPQELVDTMMNALSMNLRLGRENTSLGISLITGDFAPAMAETGNPFDYLDYIDALQKMDTWNQAGEYVRAIQEWLNSDAVTVLVTTYPEAGLKEQQDAAEAERLAAVKASMTEEELQAIIDATNAEKAEKPDTSAYLAQLQAVSVSSLPEEIRAFELSDETVEDGVRHISAAAEVDGIGRTMLLFPADGLDQEDLHWYALYISLIGQLDTSVHTQQELSSLIARYLFGLETRYAMFDTYGTKDFQPFLRAGWITLEEDLQQGYDLLYELLYDTQFTDTETLAGLIDRELSAQKNAVTYGAYTVMLYRMLGAGSPLYAYYDHLSGLDYYDFLVKADALIESDPAAVTAALEKIQNHFHNRTDVVSLFAGDSAMFEANTACADEFLSKLEAKPVVPVKYSFEAPARREALIIDSTVQYNGIVGDFDALGLPDYTADLEAVSALVLDKYLIPELRETYGVYTPMHGFLENGGTYLLTYSDPNIRETFDVYAALPEFLAGREMDQNVLNGYILSAYSTLARPEGELSGAISAIISRICLEPENLKIQRMQELKSLTPEKLASYAAAYRSLDENAHIFTAGNATAIQDNAELYDRILDPFA